ncbi:MAG: hypothetical protein P8046_06700 [Anaerolineales bacterium]
MKRNTRQHWAGQAAAVYRRSRGSARRGRSTDRSPARASSEKVTPACQGICARRKGW